MYSLACDHLFSEHSKLQQHWMNGVYPQTSGRPSIPLVTSSVTGCLATCSYDWLPSTLRSLNYHLQASSQLLQKVKMEASREDCLYHAGHFCTLIHPACAAPLAHPLHSPQATPLMHQPLNLHGAFRTSPTPSCLISHLRSTSGTSLRAPYNLCYAFAQPPWPSLTPLLPPPSSSNHLTAFRPGTCNFLPLSHWF